MTPPTRGECFAKLSERLRLIQEDCAMMAHLHNTEGSEIDKVLAKGWLGMSEHFKQVQHKVIQMAQGRMQ